MLDVFENLRFCTKERMVKFQWLSREEDTEDSINVVEVSEKVSITEGVDDDSKYPFSILSITNTTAEDRKIYTCRAVEHNTSFDIDEFENCKAANRCDEVETLLRVKDKLAALWPTLGILAEVTHLLPLFILFNFYI